MSRTLVGTATVVALVALSRGALADGLAIETVEHGAWGNSVAAMQKDLHANGKLLHVIVRDGGGRVLTCGEYALALDPDAKQAFAQEGCSPATGQTTLSLVNRKELFDHDSGMSTPRVVTIAATRVEVAQSDGGALVAAQSKVSCVADVQPYMPDLENGSRVALSPDRYILEVHDEDVRVSQEGSHWKVARGVGGSPSAAYEVRDLKTGAIVLRDSVHFDCAGSGQPTEDIHELPPRDSADTPSDAPRPTKSWTGHAWTLNVQGGIALMHPVGMQLQNTTGYVSAADLGLKNAPATALAISFVVERPWFYASIGPKFAFGSQGERTLFMFGADATIGMSFHIGALSTYVGPNVAAYEYQVTGPTNLKLEWGTPLALGLNGAAGMRVHINSERGSTAVFGIDVTAPIVGHQPLFVMASLGWGGGH
jgi:hypothetical protein